MMMLMLSIACSSFRENEDFFLSISFISSSHWIFVRLLLLCVNVFLNFVNRIEWNHWAFILYSIIIYAKDVRKIYRIMLRLPSSIDWRSLSHSIDLPEFLRCVFSTQKIIKRINKISTIRLNAFSLFCCLNWNQF